MSTFLDDLLAGARRRVEAARAIESLEELRSRAGALDLPPSFLGALQQPGVSIIAEVKRASPSKGDLAPGIVAAVQAAAYRDGGAAAISVLTEPERFKGSLEDLADVAGSGTPALRKDFLVDAYQVWETRAAGASAVLLIVAGLDDAELASLLAEASEADLDALVEVHDEAELERAIAAGAGIIGVNARDLRSFEVDRDAFARLRPAIPEATIAIAESGIRGPDDVRAAAGRGADAVLVGESLVTAADPRAAVAALVEAGRTPATQRAGA
ncbi:MAG TPA: indole-3-glycerol phosphate synthase TrpC [Nitriliruptorales bacterium]